MPRFSIVRMIISFRVVKFVKCRQKPSRADAKFSGGNILSISGFSFGGMNDPDDDEVKKTLVIDPVYGVRDTLCENDAVKPSWFISEN